MLGIIRIFTHHFVVQPLSPSFHKHTVRFSRNFLFQQHFRNTRGEIISSNSKMFAAANADRSLFRFHYNVYLDFIYFLKDHFVKDDQYQVIQENIPLYKEANFIINDEYSPREYQIPVIDYMTNPEHKRFKLLALQTGEGKTISSFFAMERMKIRTAILLRPGYINRWLDEINKVFNNVNVISVIGGDSLKQLISLSKSESLDFDMCLISNKTFQVYLSQYELLKENILNQGYECIPESFFETIGVGNRIIDEIHQDFHLNFKIDLYTNVEYSTSLSATLVNRDAFLESMYDIAYPKSLRYYSDRVKKFVKATAVFYSIDPKYNIRTTRRGTNTYSHVVYEESIERHSKVLNDYREMVGYYVKYGFIDDMKPEDKLIIFAGTVKMCSILTNYLKTIYPNLSIEKYTSEDDYTNLIDSTIRVTTIGSGGTAHDIPNLTTILMTVAIDSIQSNLQSFGRLRNIKDRELKYIYIVDQDQGKQMDYHKRRFKMLQERALSVNTLWYPKTLGFGR